MKTKEKMLQMLEAESNEWVSGEKAAESLSISRAAVWKAVMALRSEGYVIDAVRNRGYRLSTDADVLSELNICRLLKPECRMLDIHVLPEVSSTNELIREKAAEGAPEGTVFIAGMQTDGKGRLGRRFYSPADTGVYMSLLLRPVSLDPMQSLRLTTMAAVAACETVEAVSGKPAQIKWVNDVYLEGKKVCGILTEGVVNLEAGRLDPVILGIGINAYMPEDGFPSEIENIAGVVFSDRQKDGKNRLAAGFLNRFMKLYLSGDFQTYIASYRNHSLTTGREIIVFSPKGSRKAIARDIDAECRLVVEYEDGTIERLFSGEISICLNNKE